MINFQSSFRKIREEIKKDKQENFFNVFFILFLISIPLHHTINNFFGALFLISNLIIVRKNSALNTHLFLPIFLYIVMLLSVTYTIDRFETLEAILKEFPLFIIPLIFILNNKKYRIKEQSILKTYSYSIVLYSIFFLFNAFINYFSSNNTNVFFYHDLVSKDLNAIHVSVFVSMAFFYFLMRDIKKTSDYILTVYLFTFLLLLSSKIIIFTTLILVLVYFFFYSKSANRMRLRNLTLMVTLALGFLFFGKIKEKALFEFKIKAESNIGHTVINKDNIGSNIISMKEAWCNEKFNQTDYFSGSSFRVYQARLFLEFLKEENIFWTGFGLNASYKKLEEKGIYYNIFQGNNEVEGYQKKNFHNQYIQVFAELGIFGFLILILILFFNLKNAIKHKDFIHIAFAVLMISLFLTESFLWRQRGVVFFTLFYCLLNSSNKEKNLI